MPRMSVIMATARDDFPLVQAPDWHIFGGPAADLREQTFQDFEWIVVDLRHGDRARWFEENPQPFSVRHVPPKPNYWLEGKKRAVCACRNTGAALARGELLVFIDDAWSLPPDFLEQHWAWYKRGAFGAALYRTSPKPGDETVRPDPREDLLGTDGICLHSEGVDIRTPPTYGGIGVSRAMFEAVGGYNEVMDACWGLEDIEFGWRVQGAGGHFVLDERLFFVAHNSHGFSAEVLRPTGYNTLCCEPMVRVLWDRVYAAETRAGRPLSAEEQRWFVPKCVYWTDGNCDLYGPEHPCSQHRSVSHPDPTAPDVAHALGLPWPPSPSA